MVSSRLMNLISLGFLFGIVVTVFWQIETDLKEQGIASGGPYDDASSYPRSIAIFMGVLLFVQLLTVLQKKEPSLRMDKAETSGLCRAGMMILVFAAYLVALTSVGYHFATAPMIFAIMWLCGMRHYLKMAISSIAIALLFAFFFEVMLNVVLPLGLWNIFIPW